MLSSRRSNSSDSSITVDDFGPLIAETENSQVYEYSKNEVIKVMRLNASTARELSFSKALKDCPVVLSPRKELTVGNSIGLIYPFTEDFPQQQFLDDVWHRAVEILATLEKLGITHLDFRPENLCYLNGQIYVRDFGNSYLLSSSRSGFLPKERYPLIQIRGPEFQEFPERPGSTEESLLEGALPPQSFQRNQLLPTEFRKRYSDFLLEKIGGSEFDPRADLWSLACWIYQRIEGIWPVNSVGDYSVIKTDHLPRKYGKIGTYLKTILKSTDYRNRPWASQIAQELSIPANPFKLHLPEPVLSWDRLENADLPELWARSTQPGENITGQYLWILLAAQRNAGSNAAEVIPLFTEEEDWDEEVISVFGNIGNQLYTDNVLTAYRLGSLREKYFSLIRSPGSFNSSDLETQREYLIQNELAQSTTNLALIGKEVF